MLGIFTDENQSLSLQADRIYHEYQEQSCKQTDRMFAALMFLQWIGGILAATLISPYTWIGQTSQIHLHVWSAVFLGGAISIFPILLVLARPGKVETRYTIAVAQMLMSSLLIHLMGGRIETHFHVFGSLAFLSFYRDWRVLVPATVVVAADHYLRGAFYPQSVFGVLTPDSWRWVEHAAWVIFEDIFLVLSCLRGSAEMRLRAWQVAKLDHDFTEHKRTQEALKKSEEYRNLFKHANDAIIIFDPENKRVLNVNDRACEMYGFSREDLLANKLSLLTRTDKRLTENLSKGFTSAFECVHYHQNGEPLDLMINASVIEFEGKTAILSINHNITERVHAEKQLVHNAFHDALTGLPNRALFHEHLRAAIDRAARRLTTFAVLFLDFDRFKVVNDSLGHLEGDKLLVQIARRLESCLRTSDIVARLGGDEFTILLDEFDDTEDAFSIVERIQQSLKEPFELSGREVFTSASIGIALSNAAYTNPEELLRDADIAMYRAKELGRARYQIFNQAMHERASVRLQLETEIRRAVERGEFRMFYQPIIEIQSGKTIGFESLVRWQHPERGIVSPDDFIPIAEETGQIIPLGEWVLRESCRQFREWQNEKIADENLTISVNLSCKQFMQSDLVERITAILQETQLKAECLRLEITESHLIEDSELAVTIIKRLRDIGVKLSIDDFGTGYSSLSYLHRLPIDYLKIDRSFVSRMLTNNENSEIVQTVITLAKNLGIEVIAEGIETIEQAEQLRKLNCRFGQGYFYSKPVNAEKARDIISAAQFANEIFEDEPILSLKIVS
ncbi:MAG TPA: EAL domain-containing protein [Pyrinomonadaceae bacterium]|jgi:diguanylate cyclase (GGDEF)-like protein/PAS domain S-box-containing protein